MLIHHGEAVIKNLEHKTITFFSTYIKQIDCSTSIARNLYVYGS